MNCPHCAGRNVGRIGPERYYCWDCCVEFEHGRDGWAVFSVDDDGQLMPLDGGVPAGEAPGDVAAAGG